MKSKDRYVKIILHRKSKTAEPEVDSRTKGPEEESSVPYSQRH